MKRKAASGHSNGGHDAKGKEKEQSEKVPQGLHGVKKVDHVEVFDGKNPDSKSVKKVKYEDLEEERRKEIQQDMQRLEKEFKDVKNQLYTEKIEALNKECQEIMEGKIFPFVIAWMLHFLQFVSIYLESTVL